MDNSAFGHQNSECCLSDEVTRGQSARVGEAPRTAVETLEGCRCRGMNGEQTNIMHPALLRTGGPASGVVWGLHAAQPVFEDSNWGRTLSLSTDLVGGLPN